MLISTLIAVQLLLILSTNISSAIADCQFDPIGAKEKPLPVTSNDNSLVYPKYGQTTVSLRTDETIDFACPGGKVLLNSLTSSDIVQGTCVSDVSLKIQGREYLWNELHCNTISTSISRFTNRTCGQGGKEAEIGFLLQDGRFIRQILICFDTDYERTLYVQYEIVPSIDRRTASTPRPFFEEDHGFFHVVSVNSLYLRATQRTTINRQLGLTNTNTKYIQGGELYFLSRGHMAARSDFYYPAQLNATFRYINAAPQWQSFNGYNWNQIEIDSRNYADNRNITLKVWTGTYGIATLPHEDTKEDVELYLYAENGVKEIPVPAIYWKMVYNPEANKAVVLIGVNNPYENNVSRYVICPDISNKLSWLQWNKTSIQNGYSYACTVSDFRKVVTYAPSIPGVTGLLL